MDPFTTTGLIGGGISFLKGLGGLFGNNNKNNPANAGMNYINQIPGQIKPYYDPYINAGKDSLGELQNQYGNLVNNPGKKFSDLGAGYTESPGYQATLRQALSAATNAAAMGYGGGLGTFGHEQLAATAAGDAANKDYEQYINHIMDLYNTGLGGQQYIENQGYDASNSYANNLTQTAAAQAQLATLGQDWKNQQNQQNWSDIVGGLSQGAGSYFLGPKINDYYNYYMNHGGY